MRQHYTESVKAEDILTRLDELEKEEAKVVYMEKFVKSGVLPREGTEMYKIIYKK